MGKTDAIKIISLNRKAKFNYQLMETLEAGLSLLGSEIKSARTGNAQLRDAFVEPINNELWLQNAHIAPYKMSHSQNHDPMRPRKLLLHRREINKLIIKTREAGLTIIPTKMYLRHGRAKIEIAVARGKRQYDKRQSIAEREMKRSMRRQLGRRK
ncbi:MAG: SsrA-binding protein SmpB [Chloroflexota bacterium]|jgi:SsrA-binding protein|nr:SsrA-binding protein [Anaerolineaceae bacterium]MEE3255528.1 SsrA-binding protein SmpB [Chloroflexota bacterium]HJO90300.1 SsrA-binding protein SmpB [Anaerolineales bacterium]|tara:strand:- start:3666 stop:4130 length:465 start_codon:yes stop_codon:yes gene_type:complete